MLTVFVRAVILFLTSVLAMRMMGKRQVGQLQPFELVVAIMIAELAATPMGSVGVPLLYGLLPMAALIICHGVLSFVGMKSERFRAWLCGRPTVLIRNGVICEKQLRKSSFTLNDLMEELRPCMADRFVLTLINNRMVGRQDFDFLENGAVFLSDSGRRSVLKRWQERKKEPLTHPYLQEKLSWGLVPYLQALLLARCLRGDLDAYPPFLWK